MPHPIPQRSPSNTPTPSTTHIATPKPATPARYTCYDTGTFLALYIVLATTCTVDAASEAFEQSENVSRAHQTIEITDAHAGLARGARLKHTAQQQRTLHHLPHRMQHALPREPVSSSGKMRLPCNHTVGSRCIATWLDPTGAAANNSCPVCRHVFSPAQPRPYLEHGIIDGGHVNRAGIGEPTDAEGLGFGPGSPFYSGTDDANETHDEVTGLEEEIMAGSFDHYAIVDDLAITKILCETYCYRFNLSPSATAIDIARRLGENLYVACRSGNRRSSFIAAVSVLVASFLTDVPRTVHSVSVVFDVAAAEILGLYRSRVRAALNDERLLAVIGRGQLDAVLGLLPDAPA